MSKAAKLSAGIGALILVIIGILIASYFLFWRPVSGTELYRSALTTALKTQKDPYVSFTTESPDVKVSGEQTGGLDGSDGKLQGTLNVRTTQEGVPLTLDGDIRIFAGSANVESFIRLTSITSPDEQYRDAVSAYAAPLLGKWSRTEAPRTDESSTFASDGPAAGLSAAGIFAPIANFNDSERTRFFQLVDKYTLYKADKKVNTADYKGAKARELRVTITKDSFTEFDREAAQAFKDKGYVASSQTFIDELFGKGPLTASVYVDQSTARIKGVKTDVTFSAPVVESTFNTSMTGVVTSVYIDYDRTLSVDKPTDYVSADAESTEQ